MSVPGKYAKIGMRRFAGIAILGLVALFTVGETMHARHAVQARFVVPFYRGENPGEGADGIEAQAAQMLSAYPDFRAKVVGYTEAGGDASADVALSARRAQIVRDALVDSGVAADRVTSFGQGSANPLPHTPDESDSAYARRLARVEISLERK